MGKQEQAFALFSKGKTPGDPEVIALGLKRETIKKYYRRWLKSQEPVVEVEVQGVPLGSLRIGQEFRFEGSLYRIRQNRTCAFLEWAPAAKCYIERHSRRLSPGILVKAT